MGYFVSEVVEWLSSAQGASEPAPMWNSLNPTPMWSEQWSASSGAEAAIARTGMTAERSNAVAGQAATFAAAVGVAGSGPCR